MKKFNKKQERYLRLVTNNYEDKLLHLTNEISPQLAQRRCDNDVTTSPLTLPQRCDTVKNESCVDVGFLRCGNVALRRYQDIVTTLLQRHHDI